MRAVNGCGRFAAQGFQLDSHYKVEIIDPRQHEEERRIGTAGVTCLGNNLRNHGDKYERY